MEALTTSGIAIRRSAGVHEATEYFDVGNHHFPSVARTALAQKLVESAPSSSKVAFGSGGGEAIDIALKSARTPPSAARSSRSSRPTTVTPDWRWPPGTIGSRRCSVRPTRRLRPGAVRRCRRDGAGALRPGRRRCDHGDDPRDIRFPAAPNGIPRVRQGPHRPYARSTSPTRSRPD